MIQLARIGVLAAIIGLMFAGYHGDPMLGLFAAVSHLAHLIGWAGGNIPDGQYLKAVENYLQ